MLTTNGFITQEDCLAALNWFLGSNADGQAVIREAYAADCKAAANPQILQEASEMLLVECSVS